MPFEREKLHEALAFFSSSVKNPGWIKLLKLIYYLDLVHFRQTGRRVTNLRYEAWERGPVPPSLWHELRNPGSPIHKDFDVASSQIETVQRDIPTIDSDPDRMERQAPVTAIRKPGSIKPKVPFENRYLSRKEMEIAKALTEIFRDAIADHMSEASHNRRGPWDEARRSETNDATIDFLLGDVGLGKPEHRMSPDEIREYLADRLEG